MDSRQLTQNIILSDYPFPRNPAGCRMVLAAIAAHSHPRTGTAFPSQARIASLTDLSVRQVRRCINALILDGVLTVVDRSPRRTVYRVHSSFQTPDSAS